MLCPHAEVGDARRRDDCDLVAPELLGGHAQDVPQHDARVFGGRHRWHAGIHHRLGPVQELAHVDAHRRAGREAEVGEHRVASADGRPAEEDPPKAVALGDVLHLGVRVGDRDEAPARLLRGRPAAPRGRRSTA